MERQYYRAILVAALLLAGSCANVPDVEEKLDEAATRKGTDAAAHGSRHDPESADSIEQILDLTRAVTNAEVSGGNDVQLLIDGPEAFAAIFTAVANARSHVHLEYYIFEEISHDGVALSDLLVAKLNAGVDVRILYDAFGSGNTDPAFFDKLDDAGALLVPFNPLNPLDAETDWSLNERDHRKIAIVDGAVAITGGINISKSYLGSLPPLGRPSGADESLPWRDTAIRIVGPAVHEFQRLFVKHWETQSGTEIQSSALYPAVSPANDKTLLVLDTGPDQEVPEAYAMTLAALRYARHRAWITTPYFVPTDEHLDALIAAARRGVDVRLLLPQRSDAISVNTVAWSYYEKLLDNGIRILELTNATLHAKTMVFDGRWSIVGSTNLDHRSVVFNYEIDTVIIDRAFGDALEQQFLIDSEHCHNLTMADIAENSWFDTVKAYLLRIWPHPL